MRPLFFYYTSFTKMLRGESLEMSNFGERYIPSRVPVYFIFPNYSNDL